MSMVRVGCWMYVWPSHFISHHVKKGQLCLHGGSDNGPGPKTCSSQPAGFRFSLIILFAMHYRC